MEKIKTNSYFVTICKSDAPSDFDASITPDGTSAKLCSTILEIKAKDAATSGTIIEYQSPDQEPFPKIIFVTGIKMIINNKQGIDLKILTIVPKIVFIILFGFNPLLDVLYKIIPIGRPII